MKKKFLILLAIILVNVVAITMNSVPNAMAAEDPDGWYNTFPCPCNEEEMISNHWTCEYAHCMIVGNLWPCYTSWPDIECGDPFDPPPAQ